MPCLRGSLLGQMSQLLLLSHQALAATLLHSASESPASHEEWSPLGMSQSPCCLLCPQQPGERPCHGQPPEPAALCLVLDSLRTFVQANAKALHFIPRDHSAASDLGLTGTFPPTFTPFSLPSSLFSLGYLLPWFHLLSRHEALLLSTHQLPSLFSCFYTNCASLFQPLAATLGWTRRLRMLLRLSRGTDCQSIASAMPKLKSYSWFQPAVLQGSIILPSLLPGKTMKHNHQAFPSHASPYPAPGRWMPRPLIQFTVWVWCHYLRRNMP